MIKLHDYSIHQGRLRDPLTPVELKLWTQISENRDKIVTFIYNNLNIQWEEIQPYRTEGINRAFRNYIEQLFPISDNSIDNFLSFATDFIANLIQKDRNQQYLYDLHKRQRTKDPAGFSAISTPEVVDNDNKLVEYNLWR